VHHNGNHKDLQEKCLRFFDNNLWRFSPVPSIPAQPECNPIEMFVMRNDGIDVEMNGIQGLTGVAGNLGQSHAPVMPAHDF